MLSADISKVQFANEDEYGMPSCQMSFSKMLCLSLILIFPLTISGMSTSYPAVALPQMNLEMGHASNFGSILQFAAPFGALMVGIIIDKYGRRSALLFSILPGIVGWLILYLNLNMWSSIIGQMLNGLMNGAVGYPSQVYAGECIMVNDTNLRNSFLSWIALSNAFGMFLVYVLGFFMTHQYIAIVAFSLSAISFILTFFCIPESPSWLHLQGRKGDAEWSQKRLGLYYPLLENENPQHKSICGSQELSPFHAKSWKKLKRKDVWKPLLLGSVMTVLLSLNGGMPVMTYMVQVIGGLSYEMSKPVNHSAEMVSLWTTDFDNLGVDQSTNLTAGNYTLESSSVDNGTSTWVNDLQTTNLTGNYTLGSSSDDGTAVQVNGLLATNLTAVNYTLQSNPFVNGTSSKVDDLWTTNSTAENNTLESGLFTNISNVTISNFTNETIESSNLNLSDTQMLQPTFFYGLSIVSGALILIANILQGLLLPHLGIKKILIYPLVGMAVAMLIQGLTTDYKSDPVLFGIHTGAVWLITFTFSFSLLVIPDSMLGDLFPVDAKGYACIPLLFEGLVTAMMCKAHPHLHEAGGGIIFFFYSFMCLICAVFVSLFIPEIVGKTLKQINDEFL